MTWSSWFLVALVVLTTALAVVAVVASSPQPPAVTLAQVLAGVVAVGSVRYFRGRS